jgi:hypothetical protein
MAKESMNPASAASMSDLSKTKIEAAKVTPAPATSMRTESHRLPCQSAKNGRLLMLRRLGGASVRLLPQGMRRMGHT